LQQGQFVTEANGAFLQGGLQAPGVAVQQRPRMLWQVLVGGTGLLGHEQRVDQAVERDGQGAEPFGLTSQCRLPPEQQRPPMPETVHVAQRCQRIVEVFCTDGHSVAGKFFDRDGGLQAGNDAVRRRRLDFTDEIPIPAQQKQQARDEGGDQEQRTLHG